MKKSELHALFNFTEADLEANRKGVLSEGQALRLVGNDTQNTVTVGIVLAVVIAIVTLTAKLSLPFMLFFDALVFVGCFVNALTIKSQYSLLKVGGELLHVEHGAGRIDLRVKKGNSARNVMTLEGEPNLEFKVDDDQLLALRKGEHYHVYYLSNQTRIVAIEAYSPLDASDSAAEDSALELEKVSGKAKKHEFTLGDDGEVITDDAPETKATNAKDWPATPWG